MLTWEPYHSITIAAVATCLPILLSLARFLVPHYTRLTSKLVHPALFGTRHREPVVAS